MRIRRFEFVLLAIGIAALALLALERERIAHGSPPSTYSTYDTGVNGYRALYQVLLAAGVPVRRFQHPLGMLDDGTRTLVISSYAGDPSARGLDVHDAAALKRFVLAGGRLVALDGDFAGRDDVAPAVGTSSPAKAGDAIALARNGYTAGVVRVAAPIEAVFPFAQRRGVPLLANARGLVAVAYPYGKGVVVAVTAPALFSNATLRNADNAAFAYDVVAGHGAAVFDEYVHGYDDDLPFWQVLPAPVRAAFWIVCAVVLLGLIGANVRFAPPVVVRPAADRDSSAYVVAMAELMRRARGAETLVARFAADSARRCRGRDDVPAQRDLAELARLRDLPRPGEASVVAAARIAYRLRKGSEIPKEFA